MNIISLLDFIEKTPNKKDIIKDEITYFFDGYYNTDIHVQNIVEKMGGIFI